jgi:hypothetical protein
MSSIHLLKFSIAKSPVIINKDFILLLRERNLISKNIKYKCLCGHVLNYIRGTILLMPLSGGKYLSGYLVPMKVWSK